jgi:hypothetical protein
MMIRTKSSTGPGVLLILAFMVIASLAATASGADLYSASQLPTFQPGAVAQERLAYSLSPPRSISIEIDNPLMAVDLNGDGVLQLTGGIPVAGSQPIYRVIINICTKWNLWHPYGGTIYQFRPDPIASTIVWKNFVLNLDIPQVAWGATGNSVSIIRASDWKRSQPTRIPITPDPSVELGPPAAQNTEPRPYLADITFPKVTLEWSRETGQARARAGNVVLSSVGFWWDDQDPNVCHMGSFKINLKTGQVFFVERDGIEVLTSLGATIDDSQGQGMVSLQPEIWW